ncbi:hypothetical protein F4780DRAFT_731465 [Xylariomycetidae sp. FL0641]|nr:hypothetical protein F4780DRAFT_731465 [Xylariomycetidae sp. FL0641]
MGSGLWSLVSGLWALGRWDWTLGLWHKSGPTSVVIRWHSTVCRWAARTVRNPAYLACCLLRGLRLPIVGLPRRRRARVCVLLLCRHLDQGT